MRIRWKFLEEREKFDKRGNLRTYYKDSKPWKKPRSRPSFFLQALKISAAIIVSGIIVIMALNFQAYDWNESGFIRIIREIIRQRGWI